MKDPNFSFPRKILFCVLNWGLGHASRSVPFINRLIDEGHTVEIGSSGIALTFLKKEFPSLLFIDLPDYSVTYRGNPQIGTLLSLPHINRAVKGEKRQIDKLVAAHSYDIIISDNRYGCYSSKVPSYLISHQLNPFFFIKPKALQIPLKKWIAKKINCFNYCLVPDFTNEMLRIASKMTANEYVGVPIRFMGLLSSKSYSATGTSNLSRKIVAILSGPEPSRTHFENFLLKELSGTEFTLVRGTHSPDVPQKTEKAGVFCVADSREVSDLMRDSEVVICRSGYSSVMDLLALGKRAVLVPTPNMPEQLEIGNSLKPHQQLMIVPEGTKNLLSLIEEQQKKANAKPIPVNTFNGVF